MRPSGSTGGSAPAWIAERIREREAAWPLALLCAGLAVSMIVSLWAGAWIWTSNGWVVYASP